MPDAGMLLSLNLPNNAMRGQRDTGPEGKRATSLRGTPPNSSHRDRKKKRFVGQSGQEDKKKIKTESGRYISSSYKRDLYPGGRDQRGRAQALSISTATVGGGAGSWRAWPSSTTPGFL